MNVKLLLSALALSTVSMAQAPINGMMVRYPFNNSLEDFSGNNRDAYSPLNASSFTYVSGANSDPNGAAELYSTSKVQYDFSGDLTAFSNLEEFTIAGWVSFWDQSTTTYANIFELGNGELFLRLLRNGTTLYPQYGYYSESNTYFGSDNGTNGSAAGNSLSYWSGWHHIALTSYAVGNNRFFRLLIDGALHFNNTITGSSASDVTIKQDTSTAVGKKFFLGYRPGNSNLDMWGSMQDFLLYNRALADAEIAQIYDGLCTGYMTTETVNTCESVYNWEGGYYFDSGTYNKYFITSQGCDSLRTLNLTMNVAPSATITESGTTLSVPDTFTTYQWINCGDHSAIQNATTFEFTPTVTGDYAVIIDNGTCSDTTACYASVLSLDEQLLDGISMYPNPAKEIMHVKGLSSEVNITIYDGIGRIVLKTTVSPANNSIETRNLSAGSYHITLTSEGKSIRKYIQIQN